MRSHRRLLPAAVLLALGGLTWLLVLRAPVPAPDADAVSAAAAPARPSPPSSERVASLGGVDLARGPAALRSQARPSLEPPPDERLTVEVVDERGAPLPDVELLVFDSGRHDRDAMLAARRDPSTAAGLLARLRTLGETHRSDADGRALALWSRQPTHVAAVTDHGLVWDEPHSDRDAPATRRIVVAPPLVTVRVLDHAGRPVDGARVLLFESAIEAYPWIGGIEGVFTGQAGLAVTDAEGFAHPDAFAMSGDALERATFDEGGELWARTDALTRAGAQVRVPPGTSRSAPAVIRLPPTAPVVVEVRGADGALAVDESVGVTLSTESLEAVEARRWELPDARGRRPGGAPLLSTSTVQGRARFARVEVGLALWLDCGAHRRGVTGGERRPGPDVAGREHRMVLELPAGRSLVARVVDPQGEPLRDELVDVSFEYLLEGGTLVAGLSTVTDGEGRFETGLPDRATGRVPIDWDALERLEVSVEPTVEAGAPRHAVTTHVGAVDPGRLDLGDLTLTSPPVLATGRVIDPDGAPLPGAWILTFAAERRPAGMPVPLAWSPLPNGSPAVTDEDGRFVLHDHPSRPELAGRVLGLGVRIAGSVSAADPVGIEPGATGVLLRVDGPAGTPGPDR